MVKSLHILNGDSTSEILKQSDIEGDVIVWREMLCEGPVINDVGSDAFWVKRYEYFENELGVSKLEYFDNTIKELVKIEDISQYDEIVLWFEFDLFCQVNLMALAAYLLKYYIKKVNYYLVCTGKEKGKEKLQTLADYSSKTYQRLYQNKIKLSRSNLLFAEQCWHLYVENDPKKYRVFNFNKNQKFAYFQLAIDQHLQRFPSQNGLNQIENKILEIISLGVSDKKMIVRELLFWQRKETVYGFGDMQYFQYLKNLSDYYSFKNGFIALNEKGKELIL